jgi:NAD(P)-dependent dehydrogenase (short-subunit alcohol dehydrogenase family)
MKTAFVTGADRGLGYCLTEALLADGYRVFAGQYMKEWEWLSQLNNKYPNTLHPVDLDISDSESVWNAAEFIKSRTDSLDLLINNAAIGGIDTNDLTIFDELNFEKIIQVFNVNTLGALRVTNQLIDLVMNSADKLIVNISSEAGSIDRCYRVGWFAYSMSKTALNMESALIHNSIREKGGQVMLIHPGWLQSYMAGVRNDRADLPPEVSASNILKLIKQKDIYKGDRPAFLDYLGESWPW